MEEREKEERAVVTHTFVSRRSDRHDDGSCPAGPWLRIRVFLSRLQLDRALAGGADPSRDPRLALRADQLRRPDTRKRVATLIERIVLIAGDDLQPHRGPRGLPISNRRVRPNLGRLGELAELLGGAGPHALKGLAMASTLLEDGRGPLYTDDPPGKLREALDATISELTVEDE